MNKSNPGSDNFSILVCSCDGCVDILEPFFKLLKKYWPKLNHEIVLSTETADYMTPPTGGFVMFIQKIQNVLGRKGFYHD